MPKDHYVPRFYLKPFEQDGKFWVADKVKKRAWQSNADNTAKKDHFYSFIEQESGELNQQAERALSRLEGEWGALFKQVLAEESLPNNCTRLLEFTAFQVLRTPHSAEKVQAVIEAVQWAQLQNLLSQDHFISKYLADHPEETAESLKSLVLEGSFKKSKGTDVITSLAQVQTVYSLIRQKKTIQLVHAAEDQRFITNDNPINICTPIGPGDREFGAIGASETQIWCPLSPTLGLYIGPSSELLESSSQAEICLEMNQRMVINAKRFIICPIRSPELEELAYRIPPDPPLEKESLIKLALKIINKEDPE